METVTSSQDFATVQSDMLELLATEVRSQIYIVSRSKMVCIVCPPLRYGEGCSQECTCQIGSCHHITGNCSCPVGYNGLNCDHGKSFIHVLIKKQQWSHTNYVDCTGASDCGDIGRVMCSLETPEQTCGMCLPGHVGLSGNGNTECICECDTS